MYAIYINKWVIGVKVSHEISRMDIVNLNSCFNMIKRYRSGVGIKKKRHVLESACLFFSYLMSRPPERL